ncbi:uncharacterized protein LOC133182632 [Saccostrea echinata]|uniref:uncharacterized protein LOC133182632 n=1 Tax=Saccostrea echinata TaxID=191078 RepID=UPI002A7EF711|nr:uncharacterized protein LOC133182632 [Saccostrea echinata]
MESLQPASSTVVPCSELEVSEIVKYWLKLKNYQVNQEDKLKCINSASKLTKPSTESLGPIVHIMREALLDEDTFVRYSAAIAMGDILNDHFDNINFTHVFNDMVSSMSTMEYGWRVSILDLLWHHLSQSESRKNCYVAVTVVGQRWMYLCELCLFDCLDECKSSSLIKQTSEKVVMHCQFLRLWKRIIKRCVNSKHEQIFDFLKPVLKLVSVVRPKILESKMTFRAVLKLINVVVKNIAKISELEGVLKDISVQLAKSFVDCFSPEWFEEFPSDFKDGFGGELTINSKSQQNFLICRIVGNICIKLVSVVPGLDIDSSSSNLSSSFRVLISLDACVGRTTSLYHFLWVPAVYSEQDDAWINILMTLLEIYIDRKSRLQEEEACTGTQDVLNMIQPHKQFLLFLDNTGFDDTLIVDLLISPETCFLAYFTKYLRLVSSEWTDFVSTHFEYTANTSVDSRLDNGENVHSEAELFSEDENPLTSLDKEYDTVKNSGPELTISHGLALLHQYGDNDEEETDNEEDIKTSMGKPCVHNEIDHTTEPQFDVFPPKINKCLEETMSVLIKVRLKIEKYKDSSILPYDPTVLIHLIEKVEEIYEE